MSVATAFSKKQTADIANLFIVGATGELGIAALILLILVVVQPWLPA
jgi:hypothetical protein